jgi:FtsP/CotA-like multicopper oxidase with cupredoxin domain
VPPEGSQQDAPVEAHRGRLTRRELIAGAAGVGLVAAGGYGLARVLDDAHDAAQHTLRAAQTTVHLGRRTVKTSLFDGSFVPELRVKQGERVRVRVENALAAPTTIHWHGVRVDNPMDGVPGVTQPPIADGDSFVYEFTPPDAGTFFFHPHVGVQLDRGLYGALIVEARDERLVYDREAVLVLDDWLDGIDGRTPEHELAQLEKNGMNMGGMSGMDMSSMPGMNMGDAKAKNAMRHVDLRRATPAPGSLPALANLLESGTADAGDVSYPLHLVNGRPADDPFQVAVRRGQRLRLRLINAASDTIYCFYVQGHPLTVVASDGQEVEPRQTDAVILGMGERADVLLDAVNPGAYRMIASAMGKQARAEAVLRYSDAPRSQLPPIAHGQTMRIVSYADLRDLEPPQPPRDARTIRLDLDMDMSAPYRWTIGGEAFPSAEAIAVARGEHVRLVLRNLTTMPHPMHLHGHFFRLASAAGTAARKDTIVVPPKRTTQLDFVADNPGDWMFHCHNVYHAEAGMMRTVSVSA